MNELQREIDKTKEELQRLEKETYEKRAYLAGLEKAWKLQTKSRSDSAKEFRPGTMMHQAVQILKNEGAPMHVEKILSAMGKDVSQENKLSLAGSLAGYVRKNQVFTRPGPNTFGLVELEQKEQNAEDVLS